MTQQADKFLFEQGDLIVDNANQCMFIVFDFFFDKHMQIHMYELLPLNSAKKDTFMTDVNVTEMFCKKVE